MWFTFGNVWCIGDASDQFCLSGDMSCLCVDGSCSDATRSSFTSFEEHAGYCWNVGCVNDALLNKW